MATEPVFTSPALPLFKWLVVDDALVIEVTPAGRLSVGPEPRITDEHDSIIRATRDELLALARVIDPATQDRARVFATQYAARRPGVLVPSFHYREGVPYVRGHCHSCGDPLVRFQWGLCRRCQIAWRLVVDAPVHEVLLDGYGEARLSA